jgi:hypothetical protein
MDICVIREPTIISEQKICLFLVLHSSAVPSKLPKTVKLCAVSGVLSFECQLACSVPG